MFYNQELTPLLQFSTNLATPPTVDTDDEKDTGVRRRRVRRQRKKVPPEIWKQLKQSINESQREYRFARPAPFDRNLRQLADYFGLDAVERGIFDIVCRYRAGGPFEEICVSVLDTRTCDTAELMARFLNKGPSVVRRRLMARSSLMRCGLVVPEQDPGEREITFNVARRLLDALRPPNRTLDDIRRNLIGDPAPPDLEWSDFDHIEIERDFVVRVLKGALRRRERGVNILLYGPPGTGKTEFCKTMAARLGRELFAVGERDHWGGEPSRGERLTEVRLTQQILKSRRDALLLFDEMEDLLDGEMDIGWLPGGLRGRQGGSKAFVNRLLEENAIPTFWTCNEIRRFDPAMLRRMTVAIELKTPPAPVRERVWRRLLERQKLNLPDDEVRRIARQFEAAPALAANAVRAAKLAGGGLAEIRIAVRSVGKAVRGGREAPPKAEPPENYDERLVNADANIQELTKRLSRPGGAHNFSLCLHGPPGTGKSAYVRHLAERMELEVLHKRASDLLSCWVGGTEHNIAEAFTEARDTKSFLVFDEADSLLLDRRGAQRSWEITQVNEMLTWMEVHELPFACTTNLMDSLDTASLRRFTFKMAFSYLEPKQVELAFHGFFGLEAPATVRKVAVLTPGDFAVVARKARFMGALNDSATLAEMLERECAAKPDRPRQIGFAAA